MGNTLLFCVRHNLGAVDAEYRADEVHAWVDRRQRDWPHTGQAAVACAAQQPQEKGFDLIVGVMRQGDVAAGQVFGQAGEKLVAQLTSSSPDTVTCFGGELTRVAAPGLEWPTKLPGRLLNEFGIGIAVRAAELVIEVCNDEPVA